MNLFQIYEDTDESRNEISIQWKCQIKCEYIVAIKDLYESIHKKKKYILVVFE